MRLIRSSSNMPMMRRGRRSRYVLFPNGVFSGQGSWTPSRLTGSYVPLQWALDGGSAYESTTLDSYQPLRSLESYGTYRKPRAGRCALFDGSNDYATLGSRLTSGSVATLTVRARVKFNAVTGFTVIAGEYNSGTSNRSWVLAQSSGKLNVIISSDGTNTGTTAKDYSSTATLSTGVWYDLAFTWDNGTLKLYIDGAEAAVTKTQDPAITTAFNSTANFAVGGYNVTGTPAGFLSGYVGDLRAYSTVKSAAELLAIKNQASTPTTIDRTGLLGGWWMNEEAGTTFYDWSGGGKNLTITNATTPTPFHATDTGVTYNPANFLGFTLSGSTVIPRNEASTSLDAAGNALGYTGKCPHPVVVETKCITGDATAVSVQLPSGIGGITATGDWSIAWKYKKSAVKANQFVLTRNNGLVDGKLNFNVLDDSGTSGTLALTASGITAITLSSATTVGSWYQITVSRSGSTLTLTCQNLTTGATLSGTTSVAIDNSTAVIWLLAAVDNSSFNAGSVCDLRITAGGVTTYFPMDHGPGSSNTNRDLYYVKSDGTYGVVSGAIVNGTVSTIWANRCPGYVQDWCVNYGGTLNASGVFVPGQISGTLAADGSTKNLSAGKHGNPYSRFSPNPWAAPEMRAIGHTTSTLYAPAADEQSVSPADTKFRRTASDGDDRFIAVATALTGTDKTNMEAYVT